jgi:hypothetical protein
MRDLTTDLLTPTRVGRLGAQDARLLDEQGYLLLRGTIPPASIGPLRSGRCGWIRTRYSTYNRSLRRSPRKDAPMSKPATKKRAVAARKATTAKKESAATKAKAGNSPSALIDGRIKELGDWRGETLALVRALVKEAVPDVVEEWKWRGVPVWEHDGIICTGETYKSVVKTTFARGAALADPSGLFNSSLEGNVRRAIDFQEGGKIDEKALKALFRAAAALNTSLKKSKKA